MVTAAIKLKDAYSLEGSYDQPRQHIKKQRRVFFNKGLSSQGYGFSSSLVWMCPKIIPEMLTPNVMALGGGVWKVIRS